MTTVDATAPGSLPTDGSRESLPPPIVRQDGVTWRIRRAWPATTKSPNGRYGFPVELAAVPATANVLAPGGTSRVISSGVTSEASARGGWWCDGRLEVLAAGTDPRLPAMAEATGPGGVAAGGVVVSHRPGKRAVIRTPDGRFVKLVRKGRATTILDGIIRARPFAATFRMPEVLAADASSVVFSGVSGRELHAADGWSVTDWHRAWAEVFAAWSAAVTPPMEPTVPTERSEASSPDLDGAHQQNPGGVHRPHRHTVHDAAAEVAVLHRWVEAIATLGEAPAGGFAQLVDRVTGALLQGAPAPIRAVHRDLHDKQLLWDPHLGPAMLDVDTAGLGESALDLGNLRAHARWRHRQGIWSPTHTRIVLAAVDRTLVDASIDPERVTVYEQATLLRLACVHAFRPADRSAARSLPDLVAGSVGAG